MSKNRETWGSRLAIIMAVAGSAIGLGNFLRFPAKAAANGGGTFMIPYFISLLLLGIPLMWIEWTLGRYGGGFGHGTAPGIFHSVWRKNPLIKYVGVIGIFGPIVIFMYYTFIESWTLAYSWFALTGRYAGLPDQAAMKSFLQGFQGVTANSHFQSVGTAYLFFLLTFAANLLVVYHGIRGGIARLCNWALPLLFVCAAILLVRVLTLGAPVNPAWTVGDGFGFLWNPDLSKLLSARVWLEAAGQIFFTLSVGIGVILTYASYLRKADDVVLSGLTSAATNEVAEVVLGGSIVIPAAFVFLGPTAMTSVAASGTFNLGFVTMPLVLNQLPWATFFGVVWFLLLFLAGITSSVSLAQPAVAFLQDEFGLDRRRAVLLFGGVTFVLCQPAVFLLKNGVVDELDFWGGTFFLVVFALIEAVLFAWVFKLEKAWDELHHGAALRIPRFYRFIIKYITPLFLLTILGLWLYQDWLPVILLKGVSAADRPYVLGTRIGLLVLFAGLAVLVRVAWGRHGKGKEMAS
jgi:SNF family Na+-dependent transporter